MLQVRLPLEKGPGLLLLLCWEQRRTLLHLARPTGEAAPAGLLVGQLQLLLLVQLLVHRPKAGCAAAGGPAAPRKHQAASCESQQAAAQR
jgi:hypothetical protein